MHIKLQQGEEDKNPLKKTQIMNPCYTFTRQDQNELPAMEKREKTAKIMKGNTHELQLCERAKQMDE